MRTEYSADLLWNMAKMSIPNHFAGWQKRYAVKTETIAVANK
jgi:hypothetical protein